MTRFVIRRLIQAVPTIIGITLIAFTIMALSPGSPATQLTQEPNLSPAQRTAIAEAMGVNAPIWEQYARWLVGDAPIVIGDVVIWEGRRMPVFDRRGNRVEGEFRIGDSRGVLRGDLGVSITSQRPVTQIIGDHLPATLELGLISLIIGTLIGIPVGVLAAVYQGSIFDQFTRVSAVIISSIPVFWLGLVLLLIFGSTLEWLPMGNRFPLSANYTLWERIRHLILPVITLSSFSVAVFSRYMRASLLDVLNQDYMRTARAKGLGNRRIWFIHAMRNALVPIATILGPSITGVISGAVLTENIYSWPGMGRLIVDSVRQLDYAVIMAVVLMLSLATVIGYLISDILYALLDPRIRLS